MMRVLLALLLIAGLLSVPSQSGACPAQPSAMVGMMHHHHGQKAPTVSDACTACLAVMPDLIERGAHDTSAFPAFTVQLTSLSGIDPTLDPPPPRGS